MLFSQSVRVVSTLLLGLACLTAAKPNSANVKISQRADENGLVFDIGLDGNVKLSGLLGMSAPLAVGTPVGCTSSDPNAQCFQYGDYAKVQVTSPSAANGNCARVEWESDYARRLEDCFTVGDDIHMYGGAEVLRQYWPINQDKKKEAPYVTADFFGGYEFGDVVENYWLFSTGVAIHVDEENPLFMSYDTSRSKQICFVSADTYPYDKRDKLELKYSVCVGNNIKAVHQSTMSKFYKKPTGLPDTTMLVRPLWSTWAQYKSAVNQSIVLDYARQVVSNGFELSSHIEIDDKWEPCYGQEEFDLNKFPDPKAMIDEIKSMNLRVTLWAHPFINFDCPLFQTGVNDDYFLKDQKGKAAITGWWAGGNAGVIDTSSTKAVEWWQARLQKLRDDYGVDAFKFDAGEVSWLSHSRRLEGDSNLSPNLYTTQYVKAISYFGGLVEGRVGRLSQEYPIFTRMLDKSSHWGYDTGLKSMIPTALQFGIVGYPYVLPDMIGGNAYGGWPSKELYIRWLQVNIFMPSIQFSIAPWDDHFDAETVTICQKVLNIREQYAEEILIAANQSVLDGSPMNRPMWWVDPTDPETFTIDQQYMLGDKILVAPVVEEGETSRDIYLPVGSWVDGETNEKHDGPKWIRNYSAPIDVAPYFIKA